MTDIRTIRQAYEYTLANGGGTFETMGLGDYVTHDARAWAVGGSQGIGTVSILIGDPDARARYNEACLSLLSACVPVIGTWIDEGHIHVDAVDVIIGADAALARAAARGEKAIYNLTTHQTVELSGGTAS